MNNLAVICAILAVILILAGNIKYLLDLINGKIIPTKSTWIIAFSVTSLSISTFLATRFDLISGAAGLADFSAATFVLPMIIFKFRHEKIHFARFEKYYLVAALICLMFWLISNNPFQANLLVQILGTIGYLPTIHNILVNKKSHESKMAWTIWLTASFLSLYPAFSQHNFLAIIYTLRCIVMGGTVCLLTWKYSKSKK